MHRKLTIYSYVDNVKPQSKIYTLRLLSVKLCITQSNQDKYLISISNSYS